MKTITILSAFLIIGITNIGCNSFKSDHPQASIAEEFDTNLNSKNIVNYASSIDLKIGSLQSKNSLVYTVGDLSFYVNEYSDQGKKVLIIETTNDGLVNHGVKKYYFKNDSLILATTFTESGSTDDAIFNEMRSFLRNNTPFKVEERTATSKEGLQSQSFVEAKSNQVNKPDKNYQETVAVLNDVLNGNDKFDMVFDHFGIYPDAKYIVLKSKLQPNYTANILVTHQDILTDSLLAYPNEFKAKKLHLKWQIKDNEAVYVPVASSTSASGLNK